MISFNKNVFMCSGAVNSCIYDFNSNKLYHYQRLEEEFLSYVIGKDSSQLQLNETEKTALSFLMSCGIITETSEKEFNDGKINIEKNNSDITMVWIEVTTRCNLFCKHCYDEASSKCTGEMSVEDFKYVADELYDYGVKNIQFIGGEPLVLGDKLKSMIDYASKLFQGIEVFTNGTLINQNWIDTFKQYDVKIALSIYSYIPEMHDKVTGIPTSFSKTVHSIELLKINEIKYRTATVYMDGVDTGNKNTDLFTINPQKDIVRMIGRANLKLLNPNLLKRKLITRKSFERPINMKLFNKTISGHNCFSHRLYISYNLDVYPCVMERRIKHGSLHNKHLEEVVKPKIFNISKDHVEGCKDCEFRYCCFDCRPDSLSDDVYAKPWYCTYDPYIGEWLDENSFISQILNDDKQ